MKTVKEMYQLTNQNQTPLLSNYSSVFWTEYVSNYSNFDNQFASLFKSFIFFDQEENETISEVQSHFTTRVYNWLMMNDKRYSELYRINVIPDDAHNSITDNYFLKETYNGTNNGQGTITTGQRSDVNNLQVGSQDTGVVNKVTAYNSNNENTQTSGTSKNGTRQDIEQFTKGQQTDTSQSTGAEAHTLTREGQIGTMTAQDVMDKQQKFWKAFNFYMFIFNEIQEKLLKVGDVEW